MKSNILKKWDNNFEKYRKHPQKSTAQKLIAEDIENHKEDLISLEKKEIISPNLMNSPKIKFVSKAINDENKNEVHCSLNDQKRKNIASDRFEKNNTSCDTLRKLEKFLKNKKFDSIHYFSNKNKKFFDVMDKSTKSQSFYQTKFLVPTQLHQLNKSKMNNTNLSISSSITPQHTKSVHSQNFDKKIIKNETPQKISNKQRIPSSRNSNNSSLENNLKQNINKKILNVTLMDLKLRSKNHSKERNEGSLSLEKVRDNIDQALNKERYKNANYPLKTTENISSFEASPAFFSNDNKQPANSQHEANKKSYYQLASLLKEKNFTNKYKEPNNLDNQSRKRFTSIYSVKTEVSSKKKSNESLHSKNVILNIIFFIFRI